ncbi:hypothetical protein GCM10011374_07280 [Kocuria dechangensis]|uniref:AB hydrolase-1 domain-containing protein n=1 Tax=Kocuria dechangensis TaxID=1176249 RepID=A0A917LP57_9MICC|nr:hypothetical protein GCM10011374_07280 [Kocuria dechangensis]
MPAPHRNRPAETLRRGELWLRGELRDGSEGTWQEAPAFVQWEAPDDDDAPVAVLVHGGGGQSTDWLGYGDHDGWARRLVRKGWAVYLLDRPGHGRSPYLPERMGGRTPGATYELADRLFLGPAQDGAGSEAWPWERSPGEPHLDELVASSAGMLLDTARAHEQDVARTVQLLERTGPAVVVVHSAGAPAGWGALLRRPDLVRAVVAVEPLGPPYRDLGERGRLEHGLSAVDLGRWESDGPPPPVLVVSAGASGRARDDEQTVAHLRALGLEAEHLLLAEHGLPGNGHGLVFEATNGQVLDLVLDRLRRSSLDRTEHRP